MIAGGKIMSLLDRSHQRYVGIEEIIGYGLVRELGDDVGLPDHVELLAVQLQLVASPLWDQQTSLCLRLRHCALNKDSVEQRHDALGDGGSNRHCGCCEGERISCRSESSNKSL